jgi:hypothetical protein
VRSSVLVWTLVVVLTVWGVARAHIEGAAITAYVTSADHEVIDGYFSLGQDTTVVAKPGTDLHRWLSKHRGQRVRLTLVPAPDSE